MATSDRVVLVDTNILLDVLDADREFHEDAMALLWYQAVDEHARQLVTPITSFKDAYYILNRLYKDEIAARAAIRFLMESAVRPVSMLDAYGYVALDSDEPDFEDGLVRAMAEALDAEAIITRDKEAFAKSFVPTMDASKYLEMRGFDYQVIDFGE